MRSEVFPVLLIFAAVPLAARADCGAELSKVTTQAGQVANDRTRALVAFDIKRAHKELDEGDEDECMEAVEHAQKLIVGKE